MDKPIASLPDMWTTSPPDASIRGVYFYVVKFNEFMGRIPTETRIAAVLGGNDLVRCLNDGAVHNINDIRGMDGGPVLWSKKPIEIPELSHTDFVALIKNVCV